MAADSLLMAAKPLEDDTPAGVYAHLEYLMGDAPTTEYLLWVVVVAALTLDVLLTAWGLLYGLAEWNPLMRELIELVGFPVLGLSKSVVLGVAGFLRAARPDLGALIPLALGVPWLAVVLINLLMLSLV